MCKAMSILYLQIHVLVPESMKQADRAGYRGISDFYLLYNKFLVICLSLSLKHDSRSITAIYIFVCNLENMNTLKPQICKGDPRTCTIFYSGMGSNWESSGSSCNWNNCGSSGGYDTCIYWGLSVKTRFTLSCVCMFGQNPQTPNLNPVADDAITQDS